MTVEKSEQKTKSEITTQLHNQLWKIADTLRGNMDASDFKNYML
jgi:type I restriction-modification system DNA methylase subunit